VNGYVPSTEVIQRHIDKNGQDYRIELRGEHPVERFKSREKVLT
jgi:hypothetical protein